MPLRSLFVSQSIKEHLGQSMSGPPRTPDSIISIDWM